MSHSCRNWRRKRNTPDSRRATRTHIKTSQAWSPATRFLMQACTLDVKGRKNYRAIVLFASGRGRTSARWTQGSIPFRGAVLAGSGCPRLLAGPAPAGPLPPWHRAGGSGLHCGAKHREVCRGSPAPQPPSRGKARTGIPRKGGSGFRALDPRDLSLPAAP